MKKSIILFLIVALCVTGCNAKKEQDIEDGKNVLVLATFHETPQLNEQVDLFNQSHDGYKIEIQQYERSDQPEDDGVAKLQREIMSGKGPDIIDFGPDYTISDIAGKYTENLLPYLEGFGECKNDYFSNIIKAYCYQEGLYAMPVSFTLSTFVGSKETLGNRKKWNIQEMITCYEEQKNNMMLYPGETKKDVFATILTGSMEYYIDWETGVCSFDSEEFQKVMTFANTFPNTLNIGEDFTVKQTFLDGKALLLPLRLNDIYSICRTELIFGETEVSYIGFPVEGECGTVIKPTAPMLAISINSEYKEVAWDFIKQFLDESYQGELEDSFPICRSVLEENLMENREPEYIEDADGNPTMIARAELVFEGEEPVEIYCVTEEQADELMNLIESASICTATDYQLYNVFLEEAESYFCGDKSLEAAVAVMQSRASIYVGEKVK